jgi:gamma-glutamyltranspeptidase/glutathione hydrolase
MRAAVAAGHPATCEVGIEILEAGGSAADAAVAASLASCVAETVMTGLLGGGHAIVYEATSGKARSLDFFVAVPGRELSRTTRPPIELDIAFWEETVRYAVGPASCAVPGVAAGLWALWEEHGRLPWSRVCEPALRLARAGVPLPPTHATCLAMLAPVFTLHDGAHIYSPGGRLLEAGDPLHQPGLVRTFEVLAEEGGLSVYSGTLAGALIDLMDERGGPVTAEDLRAYRPIWRDPVEVPYAGARVLTRGGLSGVPAVLSRLPPLRSSGERERVLALLSALDGDGAETHTTNLAVVDPDGNACVLTTSLGLGSGDFVPELDLHLNSMLGEIALMVGDPVPGDRMESMMAPTLALDEHGLVLAIGSAGAARLRTALVGVLAGILDEGLEPQAAVDRPRFHRQDDVVNAEPGVDEGALAELERRGSRIRRWPYIHHYFGGVSLVARAGPAADPRRDGEAQSLA